MFANGTRSARDQYPTNTSSSTIYKIMGISIRSSSRGNIFTKAAKLDHLLKLKVGWQKLKVDLELCCKVASTEFESELADSDSVL